MDHRHDTGSSRRRIYRTNHTSLNVCTGEFAESINADPECLNYPVHEPIDDEAAPLTVIQAYESVAGFEEHAEWMARLVPVLASPPDPPVLLQSVSLGGDPKEWLSA